MIKVHRNHRARGPASHRVKISHRRARSSRRLSQVSTDHSVTATDKTGKDIVKVISTQQPTMTNQPADDAEDDAAQKQVRQKNRVSLFTQLVGSARHELGGSKLRGKNARNHSRSISKMPNLAVLDKELAAHTTTTSTAVEKTLPPAPHPALTISDSILPPPPEGPPPSILPTTTNDTELDLPPPTTDPRSRFLSDFDDDLLPPPSEIPPPPDVPLPSTLPSANTVDTNGRATNAVKALAKVSSFSTTSPPSTPSRPLHNPPPSMPPPGMETSGMSRNSWELSENFLEKFKPNGIIGGQPLPLSTEHTTLSNRTDAILSKARSSLQVFSSTSATATKTTTPSSLPSSPPRSPRRDSLISLRPTIEEAKLRLQEQKHREEYDARLKRKLAGIEAREAALNTAWSLLREKQVDLETKRNANTNNANTKRIMLAKDPREMNSDDVIGKHLFINQEHQEQTRLHTLELNVPETTASFYTTNSDSSGCGLSAGRDFLNSVMHHNSYPQRQLDSSIQDDMQSMKALNGRNKVHSPQHSDIQMAVHQHLPRTGEQNWSALNAVLSTKSHNDTRRSNMHRRTAAEYRRSQKEEMLDSTSRAYRSTWQTVLGMAGGHKNISVPQNRPFTGTTRRNTMLGVDHGRGSGRILQRPNGHTAHTTNTMDPLEMSRQKAIQDLNRRKRTYAVAREEHQSTLRRNVGLEHVEGYSSIYGDHHFR